MSEPRSEQIVAGAVNLLAAIVGDGGVSTWYTCDKASRAAAFGLACLDSSITTAAADKAPTSYVLIPDKAEGSLKTSRQRLATLYCDLALARVFAPGSESPLTPPDPDRGKVQRRMAADVEKALIGDIPATCAALGSAVEMVDITDWDMSPENTFIDGWALVFGRLMVVYRYVTDTP